MANKQNTHVVQRASQVYGTQAQAIQAGRSIHSVNFEGSEAAIKAALTAVAVAQ